ncbi:MAG: DMT family transporter [Phycisphaerales bacterium]|nr:DMT family transporter [Phycisphaerales bacterium]
MKNSALRADAMLIIVALIWGSGFVAQRSAMDHIGPFTFTTLRYLIGAAVLVPFVLRSKRPRFSKPVLIHGIFLGLIMTVAATLQQVGLVYTTASRAAFITGLYVLVVPAIGFCFGQRSTLGHILGVLLAGIGIYFLAGDLSGEFGRGDTLVALCALAWGFHVVFVAKLAPDSDPILLALIQFVTVAVVALAIQLFTESPTIESIANAKWSILYSGIFAVGLGFTLQIIAQRKAPVTHAAILMSFETVFGAFFGWLLINERLSPIEIFGCSLMLCGIVLSQLWPHKPTPAEQTKLIDPVR